MQGAKLFKVQNYTRCKIMQGAKLCKVQNHAKLKLMKGATLCKIQSVSNQSVMSNQPQSAFVQIAHPPAFGACFFRGGY